MGLRWKGILILITAIGVIGGLYMALIFAPTEATMGHVQRIFYFHVPSAWVGFFAFFVTFLGGILYLWKRDLKWDRLALSSAEIGIAFMSIAIITGSIWARPVWNTWWTWDPRLTLSAVVWVIYVAYIMLRAMVEDPHRRARLASVFGIAGFASVPLDFFAIRWWRTIHPVIFSSEGFALTPKMLWTLLFCLAAFTLLYFVILFQRLALESLRAEVEKIRGGE
ncbi:MAG: cytochrome c biogenesis protein CcsA [Anaerolineae bacterium]|nr:cytochrome c biogenesis protein CcsA [Anaerolineae bacterium]MDW8102927.1 cytochrome c biogenesis protein CcsA [Anaerolineae bacterium]